MKFLEIGESFLSPSEKQIAPLVLGGIIAAIGGIFGTLQQSSANRANFRNTQPHQKSYNCFGLLFHIYPDKQTSPCYR